MEICLRSILVQGNRIAYRFDHSEELDRFFTGREFFLEYLEQELDFSQVSQSMLAVPFVVNLLPLCWVLDVQLRLPQIDRALMEAIPKMKAGFQQIYPQVKLGGDVLAEQVVSNDYLPSEHSVCLFSGGVDAIYTMLRHREEKPVLVNVWGVDVALEDSAGHENMEKSCRQIAQDFDLAYICVKSTLRTFLDEGLLNREMVKILGDFWWHGAQHSIGLLSLLAPYNYLKKTKINYIASSFTQTELDMGVKCVSYPVVDEALAFGGTSMCHDGFEARRIDKVEYICRVLRQEKRSISLNVCFHYIQGKNCCRCEKCMRTMMAVLVFDPELERYGFTLKHPDAREIRRFLLCNEVGPFRWEPIRQAYRQHPENQNIRWFADFRFNQMSSTASRCARLADKIRKRLKL